MNETPSGSQASPPPPPPVGAAPLGAAPGYPPAYVPYPQARSRLQWHAYVRSSLDAGQPVARMLAEMAVSGVGQQDAYALVAEVVGAMRKRALAVIAAGGFAALAGLALTMATMQAAQSSGGGTYIMWWGPIVFGLVAVLYGVRLLSRVPGPNR
jgi:hypothetical protein